MNKQMVNDQYTNADRPGKPSRSRGSWQLMIFDAYGRAVRINNLQRYLVILGVAGIVLFLAALCFSTLFFHERSMRLDQQSSHTRIQGKVSALMDENDALMARLAVLCDREEDSAQAEEKAGEATETAPGDQTGEAGTD